MASRSDEKLYKRACEVVYHDADCPGRGRGDEHCRCDAVAFLTDLKARFDEGDPVIAHIEVSPACLTAIVRAEIERTVPRLWDAKKRLG